MEFVEFVRQVPITFFLVPLVSGLLCIGMMVYIIRRSMARRRREREAVRGGVVAPQVAAGKQANASPLSRLPIGNFLTGQLPDHSTAPASWTVPSELRELPEPDLDLLTTPVMMEETPSTAQASQAVAEPIAVSAYDLPLPQEERIEIAPAETPERVGEEMANTSPSSVDKSDSTSGDLNASDTELPGDAVEVMRVYRDLSDGRLIVQMGNQRYRSMGEIKNPDLARRFTALVRDLAAMVNAGPTRNVPTVNVKDGAVAVPPPNNSVGGMKAKIGMLSREPEAPKPNIMKGFAKTITGQPSSPTIPEASAGIASAVEEFLQFKLANSPEFAARSIHISTAHDHSIRIEVDGHFYEAIGDVVDPDVRDFLFTMMREWEARH